MNWKPQVNDRYKCICITSRGAVQSIRVWDDDDYDAGRYNTGNCFSPRKDLTELVSKINALIQEEKKVNN